jgi:L-rhamnose-H+ transport protein
MVGYNPAVASRPKSLPDALPSTYNPGIRGTLNSVEDAMNENAGLGMLLVLLGGLVHGSWALPMKRIKNWQWENYWLVYSVFGLIVLPMALAAASVPRLLEVYQRVSWGTLLAVTLCGLGWGIGSTLFGLGISRLGMALGFAIILGITSSVGSLLPLITQNPGELFTRRGRRDAGARAARR